MKISIKKYMNEENKNILIGLLIILVFIWLLYYFIPILFVQLFKTFLGNLILFILVVLVGVNNYKYGVLLLIIFIFFSRFAHFSSKEGFTWSNKTTYDFLKFQDTVNRNTIFVVDDIQKQASENEVNYLLKNNQWPWTKKAQYLYETSLSNNPYVQT